MFTRTPLRPNPRHITLGPVPDMVVKVENVGVYLVYTVCMSCI